MFISFFWFLTYSLRQKSICLVVTKVFPIEILHTCKKWPHPWNPHVHTTKTFRINGAIREKRLFNGFVKTDHKGRFLVLYPTEKLSLIVYAAILFIIVSHCQHLLPSWAKLSNLAFRYHCFSGESATFFMKVIWSPAFISGLLDQ